MGRAVRPPAVKRTSATQWLCGGGRSAHCDLGHSFPIHDVTSPAGRLVWVRICQALNHLRLVRLRDGFLRRSRGIPIRPVGRPQCQVYALRSRGRSVWAIQRDRGFPRNGDNECQ